jgi:hypothetical protein
MPVSHDRLTPVRFSHQRAEERAPRLTSHLFSHCLTRAPTAGGVEEGGHVDVLEELPAEVALESLKRRADVMFSGATGAAVPSGETTATTAPTFGLVKDVIVVIDALPDALFDRHAEHRPCGLLDK